MLMPLPRILLTLTLALLFTLAFANVTVVSDTTHRHTVQPGTSFDGTITIRNVGDEVATVQVYATDYLYSADGTTRYDAVTSHDRSNGEWIELPGANSLALAPGSEAVVTYRGRVPNDPTLVGTYWSVVMVEEAPAEASAEPDEAVGVQITNRRAVQIITELGNGATPALAFANPTLATNHDNPILHVDISNDGAQLVAPATSIELFDVEGTAPVATVEGSQKRLYPGTSARFTFEMVGVPAGMYQAILVADAGGDHIVGVRYTLDLPQAE